MLRHLSIATRGQGLYEITDKVNAFLNSASVDEAACLIFVQHTSASLVIQENADPSARHDLEQWMLRTVPERDPNYTHTTEGDDDMPAHIKAALTNTSLIIPVENGSLALGTWQGVYLWEHRDAPSKRSVIVQILSAASA